MKNIYLLIFIFLLTACSQEKGYRITGEIAGLSDKSRVILYQIRDKTPMAIDTVESQGQVFKFSGFLESPEMLFLGIEGISPKIRFFAENNDIFLKGDIDHPDAIEVEGSESYKELKLLQESLLPFQKDLQSLRDSINQAYEDNDRIRVNKFEKKYFSVIREEDMYIKGYVLNNLSSPLAPFLTISELSHVQTWEQLDSIQMAFDPSLKKSVYYQDLSEWVYTLKRVDIGQPFPNIVLSDTSGNQKALSSLKGNVILLDFWASWCRPCREESPELVALYDQFHAQGFEIMSVSLDNNYAQWVKAIKDDDLHWNHISDLKGWSSEGGRIYGVKAIPHKVLIDREGKIVAKKLEGDALKNKIRDLLDA